MERRDHARIYIETAVSVGEMMNSAETAEALTHAIRPDGSAQMQSINRGLQRAIGPEMTAFQACGCRNRILLMAFGSAMP